MAAVYYTAGELADRIEKDRNDWIPHDFRVGDGLVYSSPATLAYNSPGAEGYGVKRAALAVPESVELIISPGCCGRNTSDISSMEEYEDRFYYLTLDEADIVTGRHLKRIPEAVKRILVDRESQGLSRPKVVMLVTTCVDALLGTDMEHVSRVCEGQCGVKVRPAYMYALTRDGVKPPMVQVRESIFSLLEKKDRNPERANILGYFGGLDSGARVELSIIAGSAGVIMFDQLAECETYEDFMYMADANFNIVLDPEARAAADYMEKNLDMGYVELQRFYGIDRIYSQYRAFLNAFHADQTENEKWHDQCQKTIDLWKRHIDRFDKPPVFSVGECSNAHAPELALALMEYGYEVREVFCTLSDTDTYYVAEIADRDPSVKFYFNQHPSMVSYLPDIRTSFCIGKDASWYYRNEDTAHMDWNNDVQQFGYHAIEDLMQKIAWEYGHFIYRSDEEDEDDQVGSVLKRIMDCSDWDEDEGPVSSDEQTRRLLAIMGLGGGFDPSASADVKNFVPLTSVAKNGVHGYRRVLTPFAPDQSGAVAAIQESVKNIMIVVLDAGGCTGNICGFDLPEWYEKSGMIYSAGLRDMDAIMGRDRDLIEKIGSAADQIHPFAIALVGTPVPSTIGTDYIGLAKDVEKCTGLPVIPIQTNGMELYDKGLMRAYKALNDRIPDMDNGEYGINEMDFTEIEVAEILKKVKKNPSYLSEGKAMAFSVGGYEAANGIIAPRELIISDHLRQQVLAESDKNGPILIIGEQVASNAIRSFIRERHPRKKVTVAGFFTMLPELIKSGDVHLREEDDLPALVSSMKPSLIIGDPVLQKLLPDYHGRWIYKIHFALSGSRGLR